MHFWWKAAQLARTDKSMLRRFGYIGSNSIRQTFSRRVIAEALIGKNRLRLVFAIPDHPWADGTGTAAVRIAMTVAERAGPSPNPGRLWTVTHEQPVKEGAPDVGFMVQDGTINADLTIGEDVTTAKPLRANEALCSPGMKLHGAGFIVSPETANTLGLGRVKGLEQHIRSYLNGRDLTQRSRGQMVIDLFGLTEDDVRRCFPAVYQHLHNTVLEQRRVIADNTADSAQYAREWWLHGKPRPELRRALRGLCRFIVTVETAKHRPFVFFPAETVPDNMLVCIASDDALHLGVLSSRIHTTWALAAEGILEDRPRYNKTRCFDPFPFPTPTAALAASIRTIAKELDAHRRARLDQDEHLTLTTLYNVLAAIRAGTPLTPAEKDIHDAGQVTILRTLHDRLDEAVAAAYGWPANLAELDILARVIALNAERQAEEDAGLVRWLRPDYQAPLLTGRAVQHQLGMEQAAASEIRPWPRRAPEQFVALRTALSARPATPADLARRFDKAPRNRMKEMLEALVAMGQARRTEGGRFGA